MCLSSQPDLAVLVPMELCGRPQFSASGSPSRAVSTMSLTMRPSRRLLNRSITRSQSFAGVNTQDKPYSTPGCVRKTPSRGSRMFTLSTKSPPPKVPQPERLDEVYEALKRGLQSYLQVHQLELDGLNRQMRESKRNSRLGFLYELDKQVKVTERFMRRLEFHLSKIDELYEAYCMRRRLRDGASKMVKAYTASSGSREARESLSEASKGYKEYTENMCLMESELESQLGEFHLKMKGLAGFARLCAGDQYEIFMRYGRQRWKLRGRIELNGKQVWDSEDMVFLPLITEFLSIKVTELKSLANHVVVGNVSCETKDLFAALPQMVAVDINDLGTIKLSLEVVWNPFDKDDQSSTVSTVNKAPSVNKRFSTYNQSPPDTPSLREQAFYNMLRRQEEMENGTAWSNSSESSDDSSSPQLSVGTRHSHMTLVQPDLQAAAPAIEITFAPRDSATSTPSRPDAIAERAEEADGQPDGGRAVPNGHACFSRSLSHISEHSADGTITDRPPADSGESSSEASVVSIGDVFAGESVSAETGEVSRDGDAPQPGTAEPSSPATSGASSALPLGTEGTPAAPEEEEMEEQEEKDLGGLHSSPASPKAGEPTHHSAAPVKDSERTGSPAHEQKVERAETAGDGVKRHSAQPPGQEAQKPGADRSLEEALSAVISSLDDYRGQFPELQGLEEELRHLEDILLSQNRSRSSSVSLTVENALGSFDFLNNTDLDDEEDNVEEERAKNDTDGSDTHAEKSTGDDGECNRRCWESPASPISSGFDALDQALLVHLRNCSVQLLRLGTFGPLRCGEMYALDFLLRETRVLELIRRVVEDSYGPYAEPEQVVPQIQNCEGALSLWRRCIERARVYSTSVENFLKALACNYTGQLPERSRAISDTVFLRLAERILERKLSRRGAGGAREVLTIFQFWKYLDTEGASSLQVHVVELAEEVWLVHSLQSGDQDTLLKVLKRLTDSSVKREVLHAVSRLLTDPRGKVCSAASSLLRGLAEHPLQRERALVSCLELLEDEILETRVAGCKALACLKAKESIDQLVYLCRTDKEEVRDAAKQALLVLGDEGRLAYQHVEDSEGAIPRLFAPGSMASTAF
ncbi:rho family-interacting cell polarization regulator 1 isoform X2 [Brienomyrus brachyistius]|uniref:rho family-interacting cell polarization regulator 1 isoform X2 n=1 Tax=Brienomyrus brachyistius TaxID=42636 RepID=UPI0020B2B189|nr:rho family-interacting cell polarization regulator 1 isoform X2 [Brienomyrus brachyistius]